MKKIKAFLLNSKTIFWVCLFVTLFIGARNLFLSESLGSIFYQNYLIFKYSFEHLLAGQSLYISYPLLKLDLFKYSPTFSVLMAPFNYLSDFIGLNLWLLVNTAVVYLGIKRFPLLKDQKYTIAIWFLLNELITSLMNSQSNALIAGLILLAFTFLEEKNLLVSTLLLSIAFFIKPFALAAFVIYIFYPNLLKSIYYSIGWFVILFLLPLAFISVDSYQFQLNEWYRLLQEDHSWSYGLSVMGFLKQVFNLDAKNIILILGLITLLLPIVRRSCYKNLSFRILYIASILIWVIIFNHKAESPTYIIAICGVTIWYFCFTRTTFDLILLLFCLVLTQFSPTDIFPYFIRHDYIDRYELKSLPCILIWLKIQFELLYTKFEIESR